MSRQGTLEVQGVDAAADAADRHIAAANALESLECIAQHCGVEAAASEGGAAAAATANGQFKEPSLQATELLPGAGDLGGLAEVQRGLAQRDRAAQLGAQRLDRLAAEGAAQLQLPARPSAAEGRDRQLSAAGAQARAAAVGGGQQGQAHLVGRCCGGDCGGGVALASHRQVELERGACRQRAGTQRLDRCQGRSPVGCRDCGHAGRAVARDSGCELGQVLIGQAAAKVELIGVAGVALRGAPAHLHVAGPQPTLQRRLDRRSLG